MVEHLCDCDLSTVTPAAAEDSTADEIEARLQSALSLSPFRQQFDNFARLIKLSADDAKVRSFGPATARVLRKQQVSLAERQAGTLSMLRACARASRLKCLKKTSARICSATSS
eukprot:COSAG03_NODE_521_length_7208_cov_11.258264_6_plen_114_part_00